MALKMVKTENGWVEGLPGGNYTVSVFKGIPYAAPPVGENRWRAPQPAENWEGVYQAFKFKPMCPQAKPGTPWEKQENPEPLWAQDEDCLYCNVWTPAVREDEKLPVLLWIHGGANVVGRGHEMSVDGEGLAKRGVIVVTFNWRVNIFGWLAHKELSEENPDHISGNYAVLDQIAALKWVRRNIEAFGGDPENITINGLSAGGSSTMNMCMTPLTRGLFKNAIMQSGGGFDLFTSTMIPTLKQYEDMVDLKRALGVDSIAEARKLDAQEIIRRISRPEAAGAYLPMQVADGVIFPDTNTEICKKGMYHKINYIIGYTKDESHMYEPNFDKEAFIQDVKTEYGDYAEDYLKLCDFLQDDEAFKKHMISRSGELLRTAAENFAELVSSQGNGPVYVYCFARRMPDGDHTTFHGSDQWFQFETLDRCNWRDFTGTDFDLSKTYARFFANFCKTGNPNGTDVPKWKPFTEQERITMVLDENAGGRELPDNPRIQFRKDYVLKRLPEKK